MDRERFDTLTKQLATAGTSRRRLVRALGGLVAGAVVTGVGTRTAAADDCSQCGFACPSPTCPWTCCGLREEQQAAQEEHLLQKEEEQLLQGCEEEGRELCAGGTVCCSVGDHCIGEDFCCPGAQYCPESDTCCPDGQVCIPQGEGEDTCMQGADIGCEEEGRELCVDGRVCCSVGDVCTSYDFCCPRAQYCDESHTCCPGGQVCIHQDTCTGA